MSDYICIVLYMISCVLFIMGIKKLGKADTARKGNLYSSIGMLIAVVSVLISQDVIDGGFHSVSCDCGYVAYLAHDVILKLGLLSDDGHIHIAHTVAGGVDLLHHTG